MTLLIGIGSLSSWRWRCRVRSSDGEGFLGLVVGFLLGIRISEGKGILNDFCTVGGAWREIF